jgi:hypothetical protein
MDRDGTHKPAFRKQPPIFYPGDNLHVIKQRRVREALEAAGSMHSFSSRQRRCATSQIST